MLFGRIPPIISGRAPLALLSALLAGTGLCFVGGSTLCQYLAANHSENLPQGVVRAIGASPLTDSETLLTLARGRLSRYQRFSESQAAAVQNAQPKTGPSFDQSGPDRYEGCVAARLVAQASKQSPADPVYPLLAQGLAGNCSDAVRPARAERAEPLPKTSLAPETTDARALYTAALNLLARGERLEALPKFRRAEELSLNFEASRRRFVQNLVTDSDQLALALPRVFPQLTFWIEDFATKEPQLFALWQPAFAAALIEALADLRSQVLGQKMTADDAALMLRRVGSSFCFQVNDAARKALDQTAALVWNESDSPYARIAAERAAQRRISVLKAWSEGNSSALGQSAMQGQLFNWRSDTAAVPAALVRGGAPIGIYFPEAVSTVSLVVRSSTSSPSALEIDDFAISGSDDNQSYVPFNGCSLTGHSQRMRNEYYFRCKSAGSGQLPSEHSSANQGPLNQGQPDQNRPTRLPRFLKLQIAGGDLRARLEAPLAELVQVYAD